MLRDESTMKAMSTLPGHGSMPKKDWEKKEESLCDYVHNHVYVYIHIYISIYLYTYVYVHVHVYIYFH